MLKKKKKQKNYDTKTNQHALKVYLLKDIKQKSKLKKKSVEQGQHIKRICLLSL